MIRFNDAIILALTKLKTRRLRTTVTICIASLLFGVIALASLFIQGTLDSVQKFSADSLSGRYLTMASYSSRLYPGADSTPKSVGVRAEQLYNQTIVDKKAAAKILGADYDPSTEPNPFIDLGDSKVLNASSPSSIKAFNEYIATQPTGTTQLNDMTKPFHPTHTYPITSTTMYGMIKPLDDKGENFTEQPNYPNQPGGSVGVHFGWSYIDQAVTQSFMLSDAQLSSQTNTKDIPVIAPLGQVESALGLKPLPKKTSAKDRMDRLHYIRDHAQTTTFSVCYRNSVSQAQIQSAIDTAKDIAANKTTKDYVKPSLIYSLPTDPMSCSAAVISSDTRTATEKRQAAKQDQFAAKFGQETEAVQQKVTFRTVGISPDALNVESFSAIDALISGIAGSNLSGQWVVPQQLFDAMPNKQDFTHFLPSADATGQSINYASTQAIVEFGNATDAEEFVTNVGCGLQYCDSERSATYFGSNSVLIDDIRDQATTVLGYAAITIAVIASLIMMGMTGRVISDSRRETAVFRAIGAKRGDIRLIYVVYTIILSLIIVGASLVLGVVAAWFINTKLSPDASVQAHLTYIFTDDNLAFSFIGLWWQALAALVGLIVVAGLVGMLLPLSRNLARSPIKDMRDDT